MDSDQTPNPDVAAAESQPQAAGALQLQPQIAELMAKAGLDPATAKPQEVVDFLQKGNTEIHSMLQRDRAARKALEAEVQGYRDLQLQQILGGTEIGAEGKAALQGLQSKAAQADGFLAILGLARDDGLIPEQLFDAVQTGSLQAAKPVLSLLKQLLDKQAVEAAARGKGVGSDIGTAKPAEKDQALPGDIRIDPQATVRLMRGEKPDIQHGPGFVKFSGR